MQVGGSGPGSHCSVASESESRSGGIQRLSPVGGAEVVGQPRRRPPSERVSSPSAGGGNAPARTRPKTSCCCYRCCFCWRCQCNGSVRLSVLLDLFYLPRNVAPAGAKKCSIYLLTSIGQSHCYD